MNAYVIKKLEENHGLKMFDVVKFSFVPSIFDCLNIFILNKKYSKWQFKF